MLAVGNALLPLVVQEWATFVFGQAWILETPPAQVPDS